ncbi:MAG: cytochrome P450 [Sphingomonadales bacterium]|nr:cytochrome P450 [Sphingomonadales bacterium]MBU3993985.1 cytochrome P450 [Alphaproteobacteria bacterium]
MADSVIDHPATRPEHVPEHLFWDHDLDQFAMELDDPYKSVARLYDGPEIIYARATSREMPGWVPTRHDLIEEVFLRAEDFISSQNYSVSKLLDVEWVLNPLEIDPPAHMMYRKVLQPWFQPSAIARLGDRVRQVCGELIDKFAGTGRCEFIGDFASKLPSYIALDLIGLPREMLGQFMEWEHGFMRAPDVMERVAAIRAIKDYLQETIDARRGAPRQDDLIDLIIHAEVDGRPLDNGEVMGMVMVLYIGGLDTVTSSLGWHFRHLARDPGLQQALREDGSLIPGAVDDLLRAYGVTDTGRTVARDLELGGVKMKAGDWIVVPTYLASRDPRHYDRPDVVDPQRKGRHLTLASGVHNCLGIHLAKQEIRITLEEWLKRCPNFRIPEGAAVKWHVQGVWGVSELPLEWDIA